MYGLHRNLKSPVLVSRTKAALSNCARVSLRRLVVVSDVGKRKSEEREDVEDGEITREEKDRIDERVALTVLRVGASLVRQWVSLVIDDPGNCGYAVRSGRNFGTVFST